MPDIDLQWKETEAVLGIPDPAVEKCLENREGAAAEAVAGHMDLRQRYL